MLFRSGQPGAHRPAPSRCVCLRRCALPVARRRTSRKSRDCSPAHDGRLARFPTTALHSRICCASYADRCRSVSGSETAETAEEDIRALPNVMTGKRKEPDLRPALFVGLVVRLRAEMGTEVSIRQRCPSHSHHYGGQPPRLGETDGIRFTALREPSGDDARSAARLGLRCHQTRGRPQVCLTSGRPRCGSGRPGAPSTPAPRPEPSQLPATRQMNAAPRPVHAGPHMIASDAVTRAVWLLCSARTVAFVTSRQKRPEGFRGWLSALLTGLEPTHIVRSVARASLPLLFLFA